MEYSLSPLLICFIRFTGEKEIAATTRNSDGLPDAARSVLRKDYSSRVPACNMEQQRHALL